MTPMDLLPFALLGGVLGLDVVSFPQAMVSRPLVAATLAGALAGDAERGLVLGVVLEMVALGTLPFGASRYPEWGSASVVGGALYATGTHGMSGQLAFGMLAALITAWASGESMDWLRKLNARWARAARPLLEQGDGHSVAALQMRGLTADLARGSVVTLVALAVLWPAFTVLSARWSGDADTERTLLAGLTSALGGATIWMLVRGTTGSRLLILAGTAVGMVLIL
ncbi:MAG TPA: PTS sugar transporter subunit IIC [Gemmatimonadaceae bacterium]|nr:PTS sugar transporter subunit IIC [Gemmatimonadaceae bacterium]